MSILDTVTSTLSPSGTTSVTPPAPSEWGKDHGKDHGEWGKDHGKDHGEWGKDHGKDHGEWGKDHDKDHCEGGKDHGKDHGEWGKNHDKDHADKDHGKDYGDWGKSHHAEHGSGDKYSDACFGGGEKGPECQPSTGHPGNPCGYDFSLDKGCGTVSAGHDGLMSGLA